MLSKLLLGLLSIVSGQSRWSSDDMVADDNDTVLAARIDTSWMIEANIILRTVGNDHT